MPREGSGVRIVVTPIPLASRERSRQEDSHSGRVRTLGKRVKGNLSRVQIPHPPLVSLASADSLISESLIPEEPLPYLHVTSWDILRQIQELRQSTCSNRSSFQICHHGLVVNSRPHCQLEVMN